MAHKRLEVDKIALCVDRDKDPWVIFPDESGRIKHIIY